MAKKRSHRGNYRQQSHQESHENGKITPILQDNALVPTDEARWIDTNEGVVGICE